MPLDDIVLFLGAGISIPEPSGGPLFGEIRDACAKRAGVDPTRWTRDDERGVLLAHLIPEVFLKSLTDAGYELEEALAKAVQGDPPTPPNPVHHLAGRIADAGGMVWTTNWDTRIETAYEIDTGSRLIPAVYRYGAPPTGPSGYGKLHGSVDLVGSLLFTSSQVMAPLSADWRDAIVESCRNRQLFVAGYAGADVDLFPALREASRIATATYWFESNGDLIEAELWRFDLAASTVDPAALPADGRHLVWCGAGSSVKDPSEGLLRALGDTSPVQAGRAWGDRFAAVDALVSAVPQTAPNRAQRLRLAADVQTRLGARGPAAARYLGVLVLGSLAMKKRATKRLADLLLLRSSWYRRLVNGVALAVSRNRDRKQFLRLSSGGTDHDAEAAQDVVTNGTRDRTIQACLNLAMSGRWKGDLRVSETIARMQFERAMAEDLSSTEHDWPEQASRAVYEIGQSMAWQGRYYDLDDLCRTGMLRISGAKWTAWEYSLRAVCRFASGQYAAADHHLQTAIDILHLEGFDDETVQLTINRATCQRHQGDLDEAKRLVSRAERSHRNTAGTLAFLLAEQAEIADASGDVDAAVHMYETLTATSLPLWNGVAQLRLAELGADPSSAINAACAAFDQVGSAWGTIRATAVRDDAPAMEVERRVGDLGPVSVFLPSGPWIL